MKKNNAVKNALDRIVTDPDALSICCEPCDLRADSVTPKKVIADLLKTAHILGRGKGLSCQGLAANQLGYNARIIVLKNKRGIFVPYANPFIQLMGEEVSSEEMCYSLPGKKTRVTRHTLIILGADNVEGFHTLSGLKAIAAQHELDHLNGRLI